MEEVEQHIDMRGFEGWFGKNWKMTEQNAAQTARSLMDKYKQAEKTLLEQLDDAVRKINLCQVGFGSVFAADFGIIAYLGATHYQLKQYELLPAFVLAFLPLLVSCVGIVKLDRRKYYYLAIKAALTRQLKPAGDLEKKISPNN